MIGVSIVVPTVNEANNIDPLFERIFAAELRPDVSIEIIVVDDSSTDDTRNRVREWSRHKPVKLVCREERDGLANAVVAGAKVATYDFILVMDADLSHPPEKIGEMIEPLLDDCCDMVIGSRYVRGGATPQWPIARKIASKLASIPAYFFTDVNDPMAGFFATTKERLTSLRGDIPGFKIGLEVLAAGGDTLRVTEIPIIFYDRFEGFSKMNKTVILDYLKQVLQLSGVEIETFTWSRIVTLSVLGILIENLLFSLLTSIGRTLVFSHMTALALTSVVIGYGIYRFWKGTATDRVLKPSHGLLGFGLLVMLICLQGALIKLLIDLISPQLTYAFFGSSLLVSPLFVIVMIGYVFSDYSATRGRVRWKITAAFLISGSIIIRLVYLGLPELMEQEAYYWNYSNHLDISYLDHPPMVATLIWLGTALFGVHEFGVRFAAYCCWFITAFFSYRLTLKIFSRSAAVGAVLLLAWLPFYFGTGLMMTPDAPLLACWSAALFFLHGALVEGRNRSWIGVGISLGLGMISKYTIVLLGPSIFAYLFIDKDARRWFFHPSPYGAVVIALLLFSPVLIWNYQHEWASFLFQGEQRVTGKSFFTAHRLVGYIILILTPAGGIGAVYFFSRGNRYFQGLLTERQRNKREGGSIQRDYLFLLVMALFPLLVFFVFSLNREVKLNWTAPLWLALFPFLGCTVMRVFGTVRSRLLSFAHWLWYPTMYIIAVSLSLGMHYVTLGLPGVPHPPGPFLVGWEQFAGEIEGIVASVEEETGVRPVVIGMDPYQISSGLAFYRTKHRRLNAMENPRVGIDETLGWHFFGWNSLMYEYWSQPEDYRRSTIVVVASSKPRTESAYFQKRVKHEGKGYTITTKKDGQHVRPFYIKQLYDYRPRPFKLPTPKPFEQ